MIIAFAGRLKSGKTELARICEKQGYHRLYFALPLKHLCANILKTNIDELNKLKSDNININLTINDDICTILANETEIPIDITKQICNGKHINTVRELLQFIGTDFIRQYNVNWHVNRIKEMINLDENYVIDDVRFQNEKEMVDRLGGHVWFITRNTLDNISNHESETSIKWHHCWNRIIINDSTLSNLTFKWENFMLDYLHSCTTRDKEFERILQNGIKDEIKPLSVLDLLMISKYMFTYVPRDFKKWEIDTAYINEDKRVIIKYKDGSMEWVENPLNIEDLKECL